MNVLKRRSVLKVVCIAFWAVRPIRYVRGRSVCYALTCGRLSSSAGETLVYVFCVSLSLFLRPMEFQLYAASSFMQHVYKRCTKRSQSIVHKPRSNFHISNTSRLMAMFRPHQGPVTEGAIALDAFLPRQMIFFFHYWQLCLSHVSQPKALVGSEVYHIFIALRICVNRMDRRLKESKLEC